MTKLQKKLNKENLIALMKYFTTKHRGILLMIRAYIKKKAPQDMRGFTIKTLKP